MQASGQDRIAGLWPSALQSSEEASRIAGLWPSALQSSEEARRNAINEILDDNICLLDVPWQMTGSAAVRPSRPCPPVPLLIGSAVAAVPRPSRPCPPVPLQMTGSAAVPQAGSAAVFKTRSVVATIVHYLGHESYWRCRADDRWRHYAHCGQNCGCCRAANAEDWPSGCDHCVDLWFLSIVNWGIRRTVAWQTWQSYCHADWWWQWYNQGALGSAAAVVAGAGWWEFGTAASRLRTEHWRRWPFGERERRWEAALTASRQWAVDETMDGFAEVDDDDDYYDGMEVD